MAMNKEDRSSASYKIDRKWVREEKRAFSEYPGLPRTGVPGEEEAWLELMEFYRDDLQWLLCLEHYKFWSFMIYSEKAYELLISFLKGSPPNYMKYNFLIRENMKNIFSEVEHLVFLCFLRLSTEKESESCYIRNFGEIIYNNYLFTVPVILDICLTYGASNHELVKKMVNNIIVSAPDFLDDFQEIIPHFVYVLKTVKEKFSIKHTSSLKEEKKLKLNEAQDLVLYLCDSVAAIEFFFEFYPSVCQLFNKGELITEIIYFYSNVLPEVLNYCIEKCELPDKSALVLNLIENVRIDMLKIVKSIFDFVLNEAEETPRKKEEIVNEYLALIMELLSKPTFLFDYNLIYSIESEVGCAIRDCHKVDFTKVNHILERVALEVNEKESNKKQNFTGEECDDNKVKLDSLITEIKDIFPYLEENFVRQYLCFYNNDTERVISAILENSVSPELNQKSKKNEECKGMVELKEKYKNLNEMLDDKEEIMKIKERFAQLSFVTDETYDDEYDDTYNENMNIFIREGDEIGRRPFIVPRVLRTGRENEEEEDEEEEEEDDDDDETEVEENNGRDCFVENPAVLRERTMQTRSERNARDLIGKGRGQGQSKQVLRNREFKEFHKSTIANHNRKKQASRKMTRGLIP